MYIRRASATQQPTNESALGLAVEGALGDQVHANLLDHRRSERSWQNHLCVGISAEGGVRLFHQCDLMAAGLSPLAPDRELVAASRIFLQEIEARIHNREDFAFETTLAGRTYLRLLDRLRDDRWQVILMYLALPSVEMSMLRVAERVAHGGHNIPVPDIMRRFPRSLHNLLNDFSHRVDRCLCFMNDGDVPTLVFEQAGEIRDVRHEEYYQLLQNEAAV